MIHQFGLSPNSHANVQMFTPQGGRGNATAIASGSWQIWNKPPGVSMIYMWAMGGGGGGAGGASSASNAAGGGGGGAAANGGSGSISYVSIGAFPAGTPANIIAPVNCFLKSSANVGAAGGSVTANGVGGLAGAASTIAVITGQQLGGYAAHWFATIGNVGAAGGAGTGTAGTAVTALPAGVPNTGGAGGGGVAAVGGGAGGAVTGAGRLLTIPGGSSLVTGSNNQGGAGHNSLNPLMSTGGSGGCGLFGQTGGNGGKGGFPGSGGGGGGGGTTGGRGGDGGDGYVLIISI